MIPFHFNLRKQKWRKYLLIPHVSMLETTNPLFFLNNVVLEFNFHSINNSMCFLLKKNIDVVIRIHIKKLNYYDIVFAFVSNKLISLNR